MYGYALANGAVGVYNGLDRVWRAKVRCGCSAMCIRVHTYVRMLYSTHMDATGISVHATVLGWGECNCSKHMTCTGDAESITIKLQVYVRAYMCTHT